MAQKINNPHDKFMKALLSDIEMVRDYFADYPSALHDYIPEFKIIFRNVRNYTEEQLSQLGNALLISALITQKYSHDPMILLTRVNRIFSTLTNWMNRNLFDDLVVYYFELIEEEQQQVDRLTEQIPEIMKTAFVSLADQLR